MLEATNTNWTSFYNAVKGIDWPSCEHESDFYSLPENIQKECIEKFNYRPGLFQIEKYLHENKAFCALPFVHLHVDDQNSLKTCCFGNGIKKLDSQFDFVNDTDYKKIRTNMLAGRKVSQCQICYKVEEKGAVSFRIENTIEWYGKLNYTKLDDFVPQLIYYDLRNDNTCNLACRMCIPSASVQLEKEYKKLNWSFTPNQKNKTLFELINFDTIQKIYVAGGEPTIMPEFRKFLETAIEKNKTDIELTIITNATNINKQLDRLLSNFSKISLTLSIDGFDKINKYIRWPACWDDVVLNIQKSQTITKNISVNIAVSIYNISSLSKLVFFLEKNLPHPITILLNEVHSDILSPFNFPNKAVAIQDLLLLKNTSSYKTENLFKNKVDYLIYNIENSKFNQSNLENFFTYNDTLDRLRKVQLKDYIPELEQCRKLIKKQI